MKLHHFMSVATEINVPILNSSDDLARVVAQVNLPESIHADELTPRFALKRPEQL